MAEPSSERANDKKWAIIGALGGMLVAGFIAFQYVFEAGSIVRYLIMAAGLLIGLGAGRGAALLAARR